MGKRLGSGLLALMLVLGLLLGSMGTVFAGDTYPYVGESAEGENQPTLHGYRVEDLMQWSPETDPYAEMLRAQALCRTATPRSLQHRPTPTWPRWRST